MKQLTRAQLQGRKEKAVRFTRDILGDPARADEIEAESLEDYAEGATSLGQWLTAVMSMKGQSTEMTVPAAVEMIRATPPARRSEFANEIWAKRRERGTDRKEEVPF
jgi:hypothetical protein